MEVYQEDHSVEATCIVWCWDLMSLVCSPHIATAPKMRKELPLN